jgi:hypothetical protein
MRNSKWTSSRKQKNKPQIEVKCGGCKNRPRLSYGDYKGLHKSFPFYCSKDCVKAAIHEAINTPPATLLICPPKVVQADRTCWSDSLQTAFASKFEVHVAQWLTGEGFSWQYEPFGITIGEHGVWTVDFFVERKVLVEVKGRWGAGQVAKVDRFRKQYPDQPLIFIPWAIHEQFYPDGGNGNGRRV